MGGAAISIQPAFHDPAREAQAIFRVVMDAMARPGRIFPLTADFTPPTPLNLAAAAIILTLADFETPVWLDGALAETPAVHDFLRFHTGARLVTDPAEAAFAVIADPMAAPPLKAFAQGSAEYPDRSTTLILMVEHLTAQGWQLEGPGIQGRVALGVTPHRADFPAQLTENTGGFPCGVDIIFAASAYLARSDEHRAMGAIAALPRSTRLVGDQ